MIVFVQIRMFLVGLRLGLADVGQAPTKILVQHLDRSQSSPSKLSIKDVPILGGTARCIRIRTPLSKESFDHTCGVALALFSFAQSSLWEKAEQMVRS